MTDYDILGSDPSLALPSLGEEKVALTATQRAILKEKMGPEATQNLRTLKHFGMDAVEPGLEEYANVHKGVMDRGQRRDLRAIHGERTLTDRVFHGWDNDAAKEKAMEASQPGDFQSPKIAVFGMARGLNANQQAVLKSKGPVGGAIARHLNPRTMSSVGATGGALMGALNPGEEEIRDEQGRVVGTRKKSRLGGAAKGALGGAAAGAFVGGTGRQLAKNYAKDVIKGTPKADLKQMRQATDSPSIGDRASAAAGKVKGMAQKAVDATRGRLPGGKNYDFPMQQPAPDKGGFGPQFKETPGALEKKASLDVARILKRIAGN